MAKTNSKQKQYEYDLNQTIEVLDGWANHGERMCQIDTAVSALYWLEQASSKFQDECETELEMLLEDVVYDLHHWLGNSKRYLPDNVGLAALYWLQRIKENEEKQQAK